jgi:hypothetical protein
MLQYQSNAASSGGSRCYKAWAAVDRKAAMGDDNAASNVE